MKHPKLRLHRVCKAQLLVAGALSLTMAPAHAQKYLANQLNGTGGQWITEHGEQSLPAGLVWPRTKWSNNIVLLPPGEVDQEQRYARFTLRRYSPGATSFFGTHIRTDAYAWKFTANDDKPLVFTAKMRFPDMTEGILAAFFVYQDTISGNGSEIDNEVPMTLLVSDRLWLNVHKGSSDFGNVVVPGQGANYKNPIQKVTAPGGGWGQWHIYKISWTKTTVEWYVDDQLMRKVPRGDLPNLLPDPDVSMHVHLNIWAPPQQWALGQRFNGTAPQPAYNVSADDTIDLPFLDYPQAGRGNYFDVQWVEVVGGVQVKGQS